MGFLLKFLCFAVILLFAYVYHQLNQLPPVPEIKETWWGPDTLQEKQDKSIRPFEISVSENVITDLRNRLESTLPFQPPLEGVNQHYGINTNLLKRIVEHWKSSYNWSERQVFLNQYPQFKTNIQGLDIHFIHVKPQNTKGVKVLPILLVHGWPGSVREFYEIIPTLTATRKGQNFALEVIIPSLPGYGFSDATSKTGLGPMEIGVIFNNLMSRLGFQKYYLQGGDWGALITNTMAALFPEKVLGTHSNACLVDSSKSYLKLMIGSFIPPLIFTEKEAQKILPVKNMFSFLILESGYLHLQATKPDTVGVALRESPVGLAAYIFEKFTTWTNPAWKSLEDGGLTKKFTIEKVLDNVMIYWVTRSITTSLRLYAEGFNPKVLALKLHQIPITVPSACARFEHDLVYMAKIVLEERYHNLIHLSTFENGGHFAALEVPNVLAKDIVEFVTKVENLPKKI